jgi:hypothetical protein
MLATSRRGEVVSASRFGDVAALSRADGGSGIVGHDIGRLARSWAALNGRCSRTDVTDVCATRSCGIERPHPIRCIDFDFDLSGCNYCGVVSTG